MSLKPVEMWTVVCDECGRSAFEGTEFVAWSDRNGALEIFDESCEDWSSWTPPSSRETIHRCPDHNPFCERCGAEAGELSGERDFLCASCFELVPS